MPSDEVLTICVISICFVLHMMARALPECTPQSCKVAHGNGACVLQIQLKVQITVKLPITSCVQVCTFAASISKGRILLNPTLILTVVMWACTVGEHSLHVVFTIVCSGQKLPVRLGKNAAHAALFRLLSTTRNDIRVILLLFPCWVAPMLLPITVPCNNGRARCSPPGPGYFWYQRGRRWGIQQRHEHARRAALYLLPSVPCLRHFGSTSSTASILREHAPHGRPRNCSLHLGFQHTSPTHPLAEAMPRSTQSGTLVGGNPKLLCATQGVAGSKWKPLMGAHRYSFKFGAHCKIRDEHLALQRRVCHR